MKIDIPQMNAALKLQTAYWRFEAEEKNRLLTRYPEPLSWGELFRLYHLYCIGAA